MTYFVSGGTYNFNSIDSEWVEKVTEVHLEIAIEYTAVHRRRSSISGGW